MVHGPIISTQSLFHGIASYSLAGHLPYFYLTVLYIGKCHNYLIPFCRHLLCWSNKNIGKSLLMLYPLLDEGDTHDTSVIRNFGLLDE